MIFKQEVYADDAGHAIHAKVPISSFEATTFYGIGFVEVGPQEQVQFEFEVPGDNIEIAFANFETAHADALIDAQKQIADKQRKDRQERSKPKIMQASNGVWPRRRFQ